MDQLVTNKEEKAELKLKVSEHLRNVLESDSKNPSLFVSGWRPALGWVCAIGYLFNFVIRPIMNFVLILIQNPNNMKPMDFAQLTPLLLTLLGIGGYRTVEKLKNKARD